MELSKNKKKNRNAHSKMQNLQLVFLTLPVVIYVFIFNYLPMGGIVLAFKDFKYDKGIFGSDWVGLDNFSLFFSTNDAFRVTFNTISYNLVFIILGMVINILVALLLNEIRNKNAIKVYQTVMFFPQFLSWVVVAFIVYAFFSPAYGIAHHISNFLGLGKIEYFMDARIWPYILVGANIWKGMGMGVLINYAVLIGIDRTYYEAAEIDGAGSMQKTFHISLPFLIPVTIIQLILAIGRIFYADFGLFYQVPQNISQLYKVTDVIDTYVFRLLMQQSEIGIGAAVGLYQAIVGLILVVTTNYIVKKISPEMALF